METLNTEVVVVGGGVAGSLAALSAARTGADVILVERYGFLGGLATNALIGPPQTFHAGDTQIIKGFAQELVDRLKRRGASPGHVYDMIGFVPTLTPVDPEMLKVVLEDMLRESGVEIFYHGNMTDLEMEDNDTISSVIVKSRLDEYKVKGDVFIDATGDGELIARAEVPSQIGRKEDNKTQPMSLIFQIGGVDFKPIREAISSNPDNFLLSKPREGMKPWEFPYVAVNGFFDVIEKAREKGDFDVPRDRVLFFQQPVPGVVNINMTRIINKNPLNGRDLTAAEIEGREQVQKTYEFLKDYIPGFEESYIMRVGAQVGIRESRRLIGDYLLTGEDVVNGRTFDDAISRGSYPIDIHSPDGSEMDVQTMDEGTWYHITRRTTITENVVNLMAAGRNISTTHQAHASTRIQPSAMAIGQGVGTNAALAVKNKCYPGEVPIDELQEQLRNDGAVI